MPLRKRICLCFFLDKRACPLKANQKFGQLGDNYVWGTIMYDFFFFQPGEMFLILSPLDFYAFES